MQPLQQQVPIPDSTVFDNLLERASPDQLDEYLLSINEEKELRRIKEVRVKRLRNEMRQEKLRVSALVEKFKDKMVQTIESEEEDDEPPKKKKVNKK